MHYTKNKPWTPPKHLKVKKEAKEKESFPLTEFIIDYDDFDCDPEHFQLETCCGSHELGNFPEDNKKGILERLVDLWEEQVDNWVKEGEEYSNDKEEYVQTREAGKRPSDSVLLALFFKKLKGSLPKPTGNLEIVIFNEIQNWMGTWLKTQGFRLVSDRVVNTNSKNRLYMYIRDPLTPKGDKLKKKRF